MSRERGDRGWLFVLPAGLLVGLLVLLPLTSVLWLSLRHVMPVFGIDRWAGLANFAHLALDARFRGSLGTTLYFASVAVSLELLLGLGLALVLHRRFKGRGLARTAALVPWALPTVVAARLWEWIYNPDFGILNHLLQQAGLLAGPRSWLGDPFWALHAAILADVWKTTPFAALILLAGLAAIPPELERAAQVDGASLITILRRIIMPVIMPGLAATALICFIFSWNEFLFALRLTGQTAKTAPVFLAGSIAPEGLFLAHLCAVAFVVCLPVLIAGWAAQDKLVRGLSL